MRHFAVFAAAALIPACLTGCAAVGSYSTQLQDVDAEDRGPYTVTIDGPSSGNGMATVSANSDGAGEQYGNQALPYTFTVDSGVTNFAVAAQDSTGFPGTTLSCKITAADGSVVQEARSDGDYTTVSCAASLG